MDTIDGIEFAAREHICKECNGTGDWHEEESGLLWFVGECSPCWGEGVHEDYADTCIHCDTWTCNKSHGYFVCTKCDTSRHVEVKNYPDRYERMLI